MHLLDMMTLQFSMQIYKQRAFCFVFLIGWTAPIFLFRTQRLLNQPVSGHSGLNFHRFILKNSHQICCQLLRIWLDMDNWQPLGRKGRGYGRGLVVTSARSCQCQVLFCYQLASLGVKKRLGCLKSQSSHQGFIFCFYLYQTLSLNCFLDGHVKYTS